MASEPEPDPPSRYDAIVHRLTCDTCVMETSVGLGELTPSVVALFMSHHPSPPHLVRDEHLDPLTGLMKENG